MPTRTAHTAWTGGLLDGSGTVELSSSKAGRFDVSFPKRAAENAHGTTVAATIETAAPARAAVAVAGRHRGAEAAAVMTVPQEMTLRAFQHIVMKTRRRHAFGSFSDGITK